MTATADRTPVMVFADELTEGAVIAIRCHIRTAPIKDNEGNLTGFASCDYLSRPHLATEHTLALERLRVGPGLVRAITRNEDGEQAGWTANVSDPIRTLQ
jgi:transcriptional regulator of acetoin/glycerol metabolism